MEGRPPVKGNAQQLAMPWTQSQVHGMPAVLERIRQAVKRQRKDKLTSLLHHIATVAHLREAYFALQREAAPGVDGMTWQHYGQPLEANLQALSGRLARGAYRATPVRRAYVPKPDGRQRPLGVPGLEDKIVQCVTAWRCSAIWEEEFLGFSYGFRPGRSPHHALDALLVGLHRKHVNWILDADIEGFFDHVSHAWLVRFVEYRLGDKRVVNLIQQWLKAGGLIEGNWTQSTEGVPQGGWISPVLANISLYYAFDFWAHDWRKRHAQGDIIIVRYADDIVMGFEHRAEAEQFQGELRARLAKFTLALHADKTRLLEFGRFAALNRARRGQGKPATFNFLGFTHICSQAAQRRFMVLRQTMKKRLRAKLQEIKEELRRRRHDPIPQQGKWLRSVLLGHYRYYGVPLNWPALAEFRAQVMRLWTHALRRRSQKSRMTQARRHRLERTWRPAPHIYHPYPWQRLRVTT